jgi:hypothetical protein
MAASLSLQTRALQARVAQRLRLDQFKPRPVPRAVLVPLALGLLGLALWLAGHLGASATPAQAPALPAPSLTNTAGQGGGIPFIGDPIHDLTLWYSNMIHDACNADIDNLKGTFLTPLDPMSDQTVTHLYGQILLITIPLITLGGMILGYLIMVSRTTGESTYTVRAVTPRFVVGATLSVLGIFLVSVLAQFVAATDLAMVQVSIPGNAVGGPDAWPAAGGVFQVLQNAGFDSNVNQGPGNWNTGAWLSAGLLSAVVMTLLQMLAVAFDAVERLLVLVGPIALAAYAIPATERFTNAWLKLMLALLAVRFAWTIIFILFSLQTMPHVVAGNPPTAGDTNAMLGLAAACALLMLLVPFGVIPIVLKGPDPLRPPAS